MRIGENGGQCCVQYTHCYWLCAHCAVLMADSAVYSTHTATGCVHIVLYLRALEYCISI